MQNLQAKVRLRSEGSLSDPSVFFFLLLHPRTSPPLMTRGLCSLVPADRCEKGSAFCSQERAEVGQSRRQSHARREKQKVSVCVCGVWETASVSPVRIKSQLSLLSFLIFFFFLFDVFFFFLPYLSFLPSFSPSYSFFLDIFVSSLLMFFLAYFLPPSCFVYFLLCFFFGPFPFLLGFSFVFSYLFIFLLSLFIYFPFFFLSFFLVFFLSIFLFLFLFPFSLCFISLVISSFLTCLKDFIM